MPIPGNLITTAMAIMPHTDAECVLEMALSMDVHSGPSCRITAMMTGKTASENLEEKMWRQLTDQK